jgi:hypothetical protein
LDNSQSWDSQPYIYDSLPAHPHHIRLITLLPGSLTDDIHCILDTALLDSCPDYEALSYCWGTDSAPSSITVNLQTFSITTNLRNALVRLRHEATPRTLWIDAIAIDQDNIPEKSQQITFMRHIYRRATRVVVFLGEAYENSNSAMSACERLWTIAARHQTEILLQEPETQLRTLPIQGEDANPLQVSDREETAVMDLVNRPWFARAWVLPEIGLARDAIVLCGTRQLPWQVFCAGLGWGIRHTISDVFFGVIFTEAFVDFRVVSQLQERTPCENPADDLLSLLFQFRTRHATDDRDKIWALLGLVSGQSPDFHIVPDYSTPSTDVYKNTAAAIMQSSRSLDVLGGCFLDDKASDLAWKLPSWVVDWSNSGRIIRPFYRDAVDQRNQFFASGTSTANPGFSENGTVLAISGYSFDRIVQVGDILTDMGDLSWEFDEIQESYDAIDEMDNQPPVRAIINGLRAAWNILSFAVQRLLLIVDHLNIFLQWEQMVATCQAGPGETCTDVYWQTLCAGCMPDGMDETRQSFHQWFQAMSTTRKLSRWGLQRIPRLFKPISFVGYLWSTWDEFAKFTHLVTHARYRRLGRTGRGFLCLVPAGTRVGDSVGLFEGGKCPLVFRPELSGGSYMTLVGESYVHGLMRGERWDPAACRVMHFK